MSKKNFDQLIIHQELALDNYLNTLLEEGSADSPTDEEPFCQPEQLTILKTFDKQKQNEKA